ncbi:unnamed protein product [Diplocarpon coronariae]
MAILVLAKEVDAWENDISTLDEEAPHTMVSASNHVPVLSDIEPANNQPLLYVPLPKRGIDRGDDSSLLPKKDVSLHYEQDYADNSHMDVNHKMKYPTILLEEIASITKVDCTADSVTVTFNDTTVFAKAQSIWDSKRDKIIILVTNNVGNCNAMHERAFFLATHVDFNPSILVATATSTRAGLETIADFTEISFGHIPAAAPGTVVKRSIHIPVSDSIRSTRSLPRDTIIYEGPHLMTYVDHASFSSQVTFSGSFKYSWRSGGLRELYFNIAADFDANLDLSTIVDADFQTSFSYNLPPLHYGLRIPGVLELRPTVQYSIGADISASGANRLSTNFQLSHRGASIHIDLLASKKTTISGGTPNFSGRTEKEEEADVSFNAKTGVSCSASAKLFGRTIDFSGGTTATSTFNSILESTRSISAEFKGRKKTGEICESRPVNLANIAPIIACESSLCQDSPDELGSF